MSNDAADPLATCLVSPDSSPPSTILCSGTFGEEWTDECVAVFDKHARLRGPPLVLLPDDIQFEDYAPHFEVRWGAEARNVLSRMLRVSDPAPLRLLLIDFAPVVWPDEHQLLLAELRQHLEAWPRRLRLIVAAPDLFPLPSSMFDRHIHLQGRRP